MFHKCIYETWIFSYWICSICMPNILLRTFRFYVLWVKLTFFIFRHHLIDSCWLLTILNSKSVFTSHQPKASFYFFNIFAKPSSTLPKDKEKKHKHTHTPFMLFLICKFILSAVGQVKFLLFDGGKKINQNRFLTSSPIVMRIYFFFSISVKSWSLFSWILSLFLHIRIVDYDVVEKATEKNRKKRRNIQNHFLFLKPVEIKSLLYYHFGMSLLVGCPGSFCQICFCFFIFYNILSSFLFIFLMRSGLGLFAKWFVFILFFRLFMEIGQT